VTNRALVGLGEASCVKVVRLVTANLDNILTWVHLASINRARSLRGLTIGRLLRQSLVLMLHNSEWLLANATVVIIGVHKVLEEPNYKTVLDFTFTKHLNNGLHESPWRQVTCNLDDHLANLVPENVERGKEEHKVHAQENCDPIERQDDAHDDPENTVIVKGLLLPVVVETRVVC